MLNVGLATSVADSKLSPPRPLVHTHSYVAFSGNAPCVTLRVRLVFSFSSIRIFRPIAFLGGYSFYFYCVHCLVLGLFGATWTLGGSPSFMSCLGAFCVSVFVSVFLKDYLFNYPKIQKAG